MFSFKEIKRSFAVSLWFMFLTFPVMVIRVNTIEKTIDWRWDRLLVVGIGSFVVVLLWRFLLYRKENRKADDPVETGKVNPAVTLQKRFQEPGIYIPLYIGIAAFITAFPFIFSMYQTNIMITAFIYVVLGLGLNIVVGLAGLLNLGYVAFYAVGAYSYALLNYHFGIGFWTALPISAGMGFAFGVLLGFPVLRLRGDYLAIVTLAFGEIMRLVLENWNEFSFGPSGIANIPRPGFFGMSLSLHQSTIYIYFIMVGLAVFTIFVVNRLKHSRIGRAWIALREDEVACQAMGIDITKTKLTAFALGATWAGMAGALFAAKTTFINPASFTIWESIIILCIVVLGGMGSIIGVIISALILILLPEYLRAFSEYRMLIFGAVLVVMMIFRPGGIIRMERKSYQFEGSKEQIKN